MHVGIIGLGVGEAHVATAVTHPGVSKVTICDWNAEKAAEVAERHGIPDHTQNPEVVLTDNSISVVCIASYDNSHCQQILSALANDKHVFVEKPFCLYTEEAAQIRKALAANPQLKISTNVILRESPRFIDLKERITSGSMGSIYYVEGDYNYGRLHKLTSDWRGDIPFYSVTYGGGLHIIDLMHWLLETRVVRVSALGHNHCTKGSKFKYNDFVLSTLEFENGIIGKLAVNFACVMPHFHQFQVYGSDATFINGPDTATLYESRDPSIRPRVLDIPYPGVNKGRLFEQFITSIAGTGEHIVTTDEMFAAMGVCFAIEKSAASRRAVDVELI
jgi:predicted dehydrogenase